MYYYMYMYINWVGPYSINGGVFHKYTISIISLSHLFIYVRYHIENATDIRTYN